MMNCMQHKLLCAHTFDALPVSPATRRGRAVVEAAHAFWPCNPHSSNCDIFYRGRQKWATFLDSI